MNCLKCIDKVCGLCSDVLKQNYSMQITCINDNRKICLEQKRVIEQGYIIDIVKSQDSLNFLYSNGLIQSVQESSEKVLQYTKNYKFGEQIDIQPIKTPLKQYLQSIRFDQTNQNQSYKSCLFKKINSECELDLTKTEFKLAFYDIETVCLHGIGHIPQPDHQCDEIQTIQFKTEEGSFIYINQRLSHIYDSSQLQNVTIRDFVSERQMVNEFIQYMNKQPLTIWIGFNASSETIFGNMSHLDVAKNRDVNGYDLKWLVKRCSYILNPINKKRCINTRNLQCTDYIYQLPTAYFVDGNQIFHNALTPKDLRKMTSYKLENYCQIFKTESKIENSYVMMNNCFKTYQSDITEYLKYGMQDVLVLEQLVEKVYFKVDVQSQMQCYQLGLFGTLFETAQNNLQILINREMIAQNRAPAYNQNQIQNNEKYKGADTGIIEEYACVLVENVLQNDYASLYPNIIREYNISIETLTFDLNEPNIKQIDLYAHCSEDEIPKGDIIRYVGFRQDQQGIYSTIVSRFLDQRQYYKDKMKQTKDPIQNQILNRTQLVCKTQANAFYGASGTKSSPHYILQIALAVTAGARIALNYLKEITLGSNLPLIAWDTDAVNNLVGSLLPQGQTIVTWEIANQLTKSINNQLALIYGKGFLKVTCDELMTHVVFSKCKKSYARIELNEQNERFITVKGISWAQINPQLHELILQKVEQILLNQITVPQVKYEFQSELQRIINQCDFDSLYKWTQIQNASGKSSSVQRLREKYPELRVDRYRLVRKQPTYGNTKTSELYIPIEKVNETNIKSIDIPQMVQTLINQFHKIFTLEKQGKIKSSLMDINEFEDQKIWVRIDPSRKMQAYDIDQIEKEIQYNGQKTSYHEVLVHKHIRFFADVDKLPYKHIFLDGSCFIYQITITLIWIQRLQYILCYSSQK